jgi:hypothetical protein
MASLVALCALLIAPFTRGIWLVNVTEQMVVLALEEALSRDGIACSSTRRNGCLTGLTRQARVRVMLPELGSSVSAMAEPLGRGSIRFRRKRRLPDYGALISDFRRALAAKHYEGPILLAYGPIFSGLAFIGLPTYWSVAEFL